MPHPIRKLFVATAMMTLALAAHAQTAMSGTAPPAADTKTLAQAPDAGQERPKICKRPEYPKSALRVDAQGTSSLSFLIGTDGSVRETKVVKSSGNTALDEAAVSALSLCRFKPATQDGKPVEAWQPVQYVWAIQ